jgi:hypothetical protein
MIGAILLSGCATMSMSPLTQEEKAKIHSFSISSNLGNELQYVAQQHNTGNQNYYNNIPGAELLSGVSYDAQKALESRGYVLAQAEALADYVVVIEPGTTRNYPSGVEVNGAGFYAEWGFGRQPTGVLTQALIIFELKDPRTGKIRASASVERVRNTSIMKAPVKWIEFTDEERETMMETLKAQLLTVPEEGVRMLGL